MSVDQIYTTNYYSTPFDCRRIRLRFLAVLVAEISDYIVLAIARD